MPQTQVKAPGNSRLIQRIVLRLLVLAIVATVMIWVVQRSSASLDRSLEPAGFARGLLHGALMPMALPNLIVGHNPTIYASNNIGRFYKLGYTLGVNGCGLLFFGGFFWRVNRIRKRLRAASQRDGEIDEAPSIAGLKTEN